jgi:predicted permease
MPNPSTPSKDTSLRAGPSTRWTQEVRARLSSLQLSPTREREIVEELSQHLEDRWRELLAGGTSPDEATRLTLEQFSGEDVLANYMAPLRQAQAPSPITSGAPAGDVLAGFLQSLRHAARILWKQPRFAAVAVVTIALGIGATTSVFSVVYGVLLKPLRFPEPDRLVALYHVTPASQRDIQGEATYFTYREKGRSFEDIGLWNTGDVSVTRNGAPEQVRTLRVTDGTLSLLGVRAERGRLFRKEDDVPGAPLRVVLTHGYWQQTFGASDVVGQSLVVNAMPYEVIGVLPASFRLLATDPQLVLPMQLNRASARTGPLGVNGIARLKPHVTLAQANDDVARMIPLLVKQFPLMRGLTQEMWDSVGLAPNLRPLSEAVIGEMSQPLWILLGTVGIVLLMAWTNVANLLLVRAEGRQRELAIRIALGASRARVASELLSESLVLGLAGGALGVLFAQAGIGLLRRMAPVALPRVDEIGIDGVVLLVTLATSVVTSLLFGVIPVLRSRVFNVDALKEAGRSITDPPGRHRTRNTLVVAQVALALVLLIISGLMARTFVAMRNVQPGFVRPAEVQTFDIALPPTLVRDRDQVARVYAQIAERLKLVPGVKAVGTGTVNMHGAAGRGPLYLEGRAPVPGLPPIRLFRPVGAGYFEAMGNSVVAGRTLTWTDIFEFKPVAVISENLAREYWDTPAMAIGNRLGMFTGGPWLEIVGVVGNERADGLNRPAPPLMYVSMANRESANRSMTYVVRSDRTGAPGFLRELQQAVWSINPNVPLAHLRTLDEIQAESMSQTSFAMVMLAIAASVALLLALVGVYGVVSYIAAERTYEVGIRMALGAQSGDVHALFLRHGLALTLAGLVLGVGVAMLLTPIMSALLYGVAPTDPITYAGVAIVLGAVTLLATYLPARRASRVEPIIALRSQ